VQAFIGGNLAWQTLTHGQSYWKPPGRTPRLDLHDAQPMALSSSCPAPQWGDVVAEIDTRGMPTGRVMWRLGGDGDYTGNEIHTAFLDQIANRSVPLQTNMAVDAASAQAWTNDIHISIIAGGTRKQGDIFCQKDNNGIWQPAATHGYSTVGYFPGLGYIEDPRGAANIVVTRQINPTPYPGQTDPYGWGTKSYGMTAGVKAIIAWNRTGPNAGLWRVGTELPDTWSFMPIGEWNPNTGKTLHIHVPSSMDRTAIYEWDGTASNPTLVVQNLLVSVDGARKPLVNETGLSAGVCHWLEGTKYILYNNYATALLPCFFTLWDRGSPNSATASRGANGNAAIDQSQLAQLTLDRVNRDAYWFVVPPGASPSNKRFPFRLYRSSFDDLMNLIEIPVRDRDLMNYFVIGNSSVASRQTVVYWGYLYVFGTDASSIGGWGGATNLQIRRLPLF
jgi:hypothetical protein